MTSTDTLLTNQLDDKVGQTMSYITFAELVKELTGESVGVIYKDYIASQGESNEQSNME
jgi:hypothetical protein